MQEPTRSIVADSQTHPIDANASDDRPVVIEFRTDASEKVFPMVAAGHSNSDVQVPPFQRPAGDTTEEVVQ